MGALKIEDFLRSCPSIPEETNYWFVRTDGGKLHYDFKDSNRVGVAYSEVSMKDLDINPEVESEVDTLKKKIELKYPEHGRPSLIYTQLIRFKFEVKKGDIVLIPSRNTKTISIGIVESDEIEEVEIQFKVNKETVKETFKTRKVKWFKTVLRSSCNPKLYQLFYSHHTIANATDYSEFINLLIYDFYEMDGVYHLAIRVKSNRDINAVELFSTLTEFLEFLDLGLKELELDGDLNDISSKMNINSPGYIEFLSSYPFIGILSILVIAVVGGKLEIKTLKGFDLKLGTKKPLIQLINEFLNDREKRKTHAMFRKKLEDLEISSPETIEKMIRGVTQNPAALIEKSDEEEDNDLG